MLFYMLCIYFFVADANVRRDIPTSDQTKFVR